MSPAVFAFGKIFFAKSICAATGFMSLAPVTFVSGCSFDFTSFAPT